MKALVFEPYFGGHRLKWCAKVAEALAVLPLEVIAYVHQDAVTHPSFDEHLAPLRQSVAVKPTIRTQDQAPRPVAPLRELLRIVREEKPDRVYLPTADGLLQLVGGARSLGLWPGNQHPLALEALLMNGTLAYAQGFLAQTKGRASFAAARAAGSETLFCLNPAMRDWQLARDVSPERALCTMPELVEIRPRLSRTDARRALGLPEHGRFAGMVGAIDRRKGADLAVLAFAKVAGPNDHLLLFGKLDPTLRSELDTAQRALGAERLIIRDGVLSELDFERTLDALDLAFLPYREPALSSGVFSAAAHARRPVLAPSGGWAERMCRHAHLGWIAPSLAPETLADCLRSALNEAPNWTANEATERFIAYNSAPNFCAHWTRGARRALGLPQDPNLTPYAAFEAGSK